MLNLAPNPYLEPIKKFIGDLKETKWKFPFIPQFLHNLITILLLILLVILYFTVGLISQISNSFWDLIVGLGQKVTFSNPITSSFYALSISIYFILFLPFFIIQSPIWFSGWISSRIGFKAVLILLVTIGVSIGIYFYKPELPKETFQKVAAIHDSLKAEYFYSDVDSLKNMNESKISVNDVIK